MDEMKFQKLTPTQDVDLSGYEDAFHYIFAENDIRNIAISGAYSSGKSSVIESYKKNHPDKVFMHLSLAHFQPLEESTEESTSADDGQSSNTESVIEGKILNQLIQQIPAERIPQTNFRIKRSHNWKRTAAFSILLCIFIALFLHYTKFNAWKSMVEGLNDGTFKNVLIMTIQPETRIIGAALMLLLFGIAAFYLIRLQHGKNFLHKVSVQGNEIEIFADNNDSYFDKYLNEVLYLFENTGVDGIVFEDIDRFENHMIFERLREINTLTNIRLNAKKGKKVKKPLRFFYLLRDDIFENKDRTKFFDYILPIVPVIDSSNSYNKIKEYLEEAGVYDRFDDHFLRGISLYIDDLRIVKNIFNEFLIYNKKLNDIELDVNKLLAIIVYKNIFPKDFADLQLNQGFVYTLFESKGKLISERTAFCKEEISALEERISYYENEHLESQSELDIIKASKESEASRYYGNFQQKRDYLEWYQNEYPKRKKALEDKKIGNVTELRKQLEEKKEEVSKIENLQLAELLDRNNIDRAFHVNFVNEIEHTDYFYAIKGNPYFALLKYLISRGYIDESYTDYMTFFYPNSLSLNDKVFLRAVADRLGKPATYEIESPALVTDNLDLYDFSQPETLNYSLSEYILCTKKNDYIHSMISQMATDKRFDYLAGYIRSGKKLDDMVMAIAIYWPEMFKEAIDSHAISEDLLKLISYHMLSKIDPKGLERINLEGCLCNFVSEDPHYLSVNSIDTETVGAALEELQVLFAGIDTTGINEELFDYVYRHNLYAINEPNILLMLKEKCGVKHNASILPIFFTFIRDQQEYPMCVYLWNNQSVAMTVYLDMYNDEIRDTSETIIEIVNSQDIDHVKKEEYALRLTTSVNEIDNIVDLVDQKMMIVHQKVKYSVDNVLYYYDNYGLSKELVSFINADATILDYTESTNEGLVKKFLNACLREESIENDKYRQIMDNICDQMQKFSVEGLSESKLAILIDLNLIEMNLENLRFIRSSYPDSVLSFVKYDIENYIMIAKDRDFVFDELISILEWEDVSDQQKIELLGQTTDAIEVKNKSYSDSLLIYILKNNIYEDDLPWLLKNYSSFSVEVRSAVLQIASEKIAVIVASYSEYIDVALRDLLFKTENVGFDEKVELLGKTAGSMDKTHLCNTLNYIGAGKIADNIIGGKKRIRITEENKQILEALYDARIICKPIASGDGQYYKLIKTCSESVANESLPISLL